MKKLALPFLAVVAVLWWMMSPHPRAAGDEPPADWSREPLQTPTDRPAFTIETGKGSITLQPRATFDVAAVVASTAHYRFDDGSFLVPVDLALTWGKLPEEPYKSEVTYGQTGRYYFWRTSAQDVDLGYVQSHSSNMHLIPAGRNVREALLAVGRDDTVRLRGLLVDASRDDGFNWHSSLTREDDGPGACELVWVEEVQVGRKVYR